MRRALTAAAGACALALSATGALGSEPGGERGAPECHGRPATYVGTPGDDRVERSDDIGPRPVLVMLGGDDSVTFDPGSRRARICLGAGDDRLGINVGTRRHRESDWVLGDGGPGKDVLHGREDRPPRTLLGKGGNDVLSGGADKDLLIGGGAVDRAFGAGDTDEIHGGTQHDKLYGGGSDDRLFGEEGGDFLEGDGPGTIGGRDVGRGGPGDDACDRIEVRRSCRRFLSRAG